MISLIFFTVIGSLCGAIAGLLPGIGPAFFIALLFPFVNFLSIFDILAFFISVTFVSQYIGSVACLTFGIIGESSSLPSFLERTKIIERKTMSSTLFLTALGSLIGSIFGIFILVIFKNHFDFLNVLFRTDVQLIFLLSSLAFITLFSSNSKIQNFALCALGLFLGSIGQINHTTGEYILTFGLPMLENGLSIYILLLAISISAVLVNTSAVKNAKLINVDNEAPSTINTSNVLSIGGGSIIGAIFGIFPGLSYILSSNVTYFIFKIFKKTPEEKVIASEAANNSGVVTSLIPFLYFGLPITMSEILIYHLLQISNFNIKATNSLDLIFGTVLIIGFICSIIGFLFSWTFLTKVSNFFKTYITYIIYFLVITFTVFLFAFAIINNEVLITSITFLVFFVFGYIMRHKDLSPLIFAFLIQKILFSDFLIFLQLQGVI